VTVLQAVILGIVQGLTEFLPVSSSAHLVIVPWALGWEFDPAYAFAFDVLVQMGTLLAVVVYFARDTGNEVVLVVTARDACGNQTHASFDPAEGDRHSAARRQPVLRRGG